jgi:hypothetical protein
MVVRGAATGDAALAGGAPAAEAVWHLVVNGEQRGPVRAADVTQMLTEGSIDEQTYVWRSGLEGWLRVHEVQELAVVGAAPSHVVVSLGGSAAELGAGAGMTGARSESSVLFSLGNLQSLAMSRSRRRAVGAAGPAGPRARLRGGPDRDGLHPVRLRAHRRRHDRLGHVPTLRGDLRRLLHGASGPRRAGAAVLEIEPGRELPVRRALNRVPSGQCLLRHGDPCSCWA